jgi:ATP-dependent 26S proteasome regulatory subunit
MFIYLKETNEYVHLDFDSDIILNKLEPAVYDVERKPFGYTYKPNEAFNKGKVAEAGVFQQINKYVDRYFSNSGKLVRKLMNNPTRIGLFFKGEPGTGKTFMAAKLALKLVEKENGICIYTTKLDLDFTKIIDSLRTKDPNRLVIFILDEFEKGYNDLEKYEKDSLLAFLDGGKSRDNVVTISTANSLKGLPETLLDRPGRFEKVVEFRITDDFVMQNLVQALIPEELKDKVNNKELIAFIKTQKDLTIDKLKSIIRDALTSVLETGQMFNKEHDVISIDKKSIQKEARQKPNENKKRKFNPFNPETWGKD